MKTRFCDLKCKYADFPKDENTSGAKVCRTFDTLYCKKKKTHVLKNLLCGVARKSKEKGHLFSK